MLYFSLATAARVPVFPGAGIHIAAGWFCQMLPM